MPTVVEIKLSGGGAAAATLSVVFDTQPASGNTWVLIGGRWTGVENLMSFSAPTGSGVVLDGDAAPGGGTGLLVHDKSSSGSDGTTTTVDKASGNVPLAVCGLNISGAGAVDQKVVTAATGASLSSIQATTPGNVATDGSTAVMVVVARTRTGTTTWSFNNSFSEIGNTHVAAADLCEIFVATKTVNSGAPADCTFTLDSGTARALQAALFVYPPSNTAPTITVPAATQYPAIGVAYDIGSLLTGADVDGNVDELRLRCTEALGDIGVTLSGGVTVTAGNNNSHDMTLGGTQAALLTVLATATYTATAAGSATITVDITDDAAATDQGTFTARSAKMVVIGSTEAILNGALNTFTVANAVAENVNLTVIGIDDASLEDSASSVLTFENVNEHIPITGGGGGSADHLDAYVQVG